MDAFSTLSIRHGGWRSTSLCCLRWICLNQLREFQQFLKKSNKVYVKHVKYKHKSFPADALKPQRLFYLTNSVSFTLALIFVQVFGFKFPVKVFLRPRPLKGQGLRRVTRAWSAADVKMAQLNAFSLINEDAHSNHGEESWGAAWLCKHLKDGCRRSDSRIKSGKTNEL